MLNWIVWNGTVFDIDTVLTLNWILHHVKNIFILNWIVWNKTVWQNWIAWNRNFLTIKLCTNAKLNYLKKMFILITVDLALNSLQRLIYHKNTNKQTNKHLIFSLCVHIWIILNRIIRISAH